MRKDYIDCGEGQQQNKIYVMVWRGISQQSEVNSSQARFIMFHFHAFTFYFSV